MSGHSKWHSIKHKKGIADQKRGAVFTKLSKLITIAARSGGDPNMNPALYLAIQKGKAANMTNDVIDRAIKKGTGELKGEGDIQEVMYEGYGPDGIAVMVRTLTDNKNRTVGNIRHIFSKRGGNLAETGAVGYLFEQKGLIEFTYEGLDNDSVEMAIIDSGAEDYELFEGNEGQLTCDLKDLHKVKEALESNDGITVKDAKRAYIAGSKNVINSKESLEKVMGFIDALEEDDDVDEVFTNLEVDESLDI